MKQTSHCAGSVAPPTVLKSLCMIDKCCFYCCNIKQIYERSQHLINVKRILGQLRGSHPIGAPWHSGPAPPPVPALLSVRPAASKVLETLSAFGLWSAVSFLRAAVSSQQPVWTVPLTHLQQDKTRTGPARLSLFCVYVFCNLSRLLQTFSPKAC